MRNLPSGTVTFLFTDIEGSTKLAQQYPESMPAVQARHNEILTCAIETCNGFIFQVVGDSFAASFHNVRDALHAALQAQHNLQQESWSPAPIKVRMGIHTGTAQLHLDSKDNKYSGYSALALTQRIMSAGHGGQILLSNVTENLLQGQLPNDISLRDMGEHIFKDVLHSMRVFQVIAPDLQSDFPALRALDIFPNNLPTQLTAFIGREKEIAEIDKALADHRLITITGSGGTGKTRLAIEVGAAQVANAHMNQRFANGVYFIALAPLETTESIVPTIASALRFSFYEGGEPRQQLLDYLREKSLLLIMDNFEHLLSGVDLVTEILNTALQVKIIATSRARLNVQGEQLFHLSGMDFPVWETPADALDYDAVKLFLQSAHHIHLNFELTHDNLKYITRICRLVEGMPLGILLASSWLEMLTPEEIAGEIEKSLDFLETQQRDVPERQHSMRAVFDYSWKLLTPGEQNVFMKASVFRGGFTREAAQQVTGASLRDLMGLLDKSLLQRDSNGRYDMHELLRQYAREKLLASNESEQIRTRHLNFFLQLAEEAEPKIRDPEQRDWLKRLDFEHDNLRAALEWSLNEGRVQKGLRLAYALIWFWDIRAYWREGMEITRKLLMQPEALPRTLLRANALLTVVTLSVNLIPKKLQQQYLEESIDILREQGDVGKWSLAMGLGLAGVDIFSDDITKARSMVEESMAIARSLGDKWLVAFTLAHAGHLSIAKLDHAEAKKRLAKSLELFQSLGDRHWSAIVSCTIAHEDIRQGDFAGARLRFQQALPFLREEKDKDTIRWVSNALGVMAHAEGNYDLAKGYYVEALENARDVGSGIFSPAKNLGCILLYGGDLAEAKVLFGECMSLAQRSESKAMMGYAIQSYASIAAFEKKSRKAIMLLAATRKLQEEAADKSIISPAGEADFNRSLAIAREQVDETTFNAAWAEGESMSIEQAISLALSEGYVEESTE